MSRPLRIQYPGAVYHVICRGNDRKVIFREDQDRKTFVEILEDSREIYQVILYAWVLMENHFHLLVETPLGNLDRFMRRFNISYTGYFNRKYDRVGHLYQGRYKSILVEKESYLSQLSRYIHLNPIRMKEMASSTPKEKMDYLLVYPWSTLMGYLEGRYKIAEVEYGTILEEFGGDNPKGRRAYQKRITEDIREELMSPGEIVGQSILGTENFIERIKTDILGQEMDRELKGGRQLKGYKARQKVLTALIKELGISEAALLAERGDIRGLAMELLYRVGGLTGVEIGKIYKISYNAVSQERKRLMTRMKGDPNLKKKYWSLLEKVRG
ncbi:MAG: transposase [Thermodesulfobacteriota bacterium]